MESLGALKRKQTGTCSSATWRRDAITLVSYAWRGFIWDVKGERVPALGSVGFVLSLVWVALREVPFSAASRGRLEAPGQSHSPRERLTCHRFFPFAPLTEAFFFLHPSPSSSNDCPLSCRWFLWSLPGGFITALFDSFRYDPFRRRHFTTWSVTPSFSSREPVSTQDYPCATPRCLPSSELAS